MIFTVGNGKQSISYIPVSIFWPVRLENNITDSVKLVIYNFLFHLGLYIENYTLLNSSC